jgi:hypothetical protein
MGASPLKSLFSRLSKILLYYPTTSPCGLTENDISETNIIFLALNNITNANYKVEFN